MAVPAATCRLLDMDERLLDLAASVDFVYSPLVDVKDFPEAVDVACIEGAVSSAEDERKLQTVRQRSSAFDRPGRLRCHRQYPGHAQ